MRAEAPDRAFFDGDQKLMVGGELKDEIAVERLGETSVGDGCRKAAHA